MSSICPFIDLGVKLASGPRFLSISLPTLSTMRNASRNSLKSILPSLLISMDCAISRICVLSSIAPECLLTSETASSNSSIEIKPVDEYNVEYNIAKFVAINIYGASIKRVYGSRFFRLLWLGPDQFLSTWWRHQMKGFPSYWPFVRGSVNSLHKLKGPQMWIWCFFDVGPHKLLNKQSNYPWFENTWLSCDAVIMTSQS